MGLEAHSSLARLQGAWPTVKGLADSPDDVAEWAGRKPDGKALRMAAMQQAIFHADADAPFSCPLCNARSRRKGGLFTCAVCGSCRPCPLTHPCWVASVSVAHSTARCSGAHGSRFLHQRTHAPRRRHRSRRTRCMCLRQPAAPTPSSAVRCGTQWWLAIMR